VQISSAEGYKNMTFAFCVVLIQNIVLSKKKKGGWYVLKIITKLYVTRNDDTTSFCYKSYNNIGSDDEEKEGDRDANQSATMEQNYCSSKSIF
jgi:hypothetical protein